MSRMVLFALSATRACGLRIESNRDAQLGGAKGPGNQRQEDHGEDEDAGDLESFGTLVDIHQGGVDEDEGDDAKSEAREYRPCRKGDGAGGGGDKDEHAGSVGSALRIDVGVKEAGNYEGDGQEDENKRARGSGPLGRHTKAGKIARDEVEKAGHGGSAGEGKNKDGARVIESAEAVAEILVGQEGHGSAVGWTAFFEIGRRDEQGGDNAGGHEEDAHDHGGGLEQTPGVADADVEVVSHSISGMTATPVSKPERPSARRGKSSDRDADDREQASMLDEYGVFPAEHQVGLQKNVNEGHERHDQVQREIDAHKNDGNVDRFLKALEEDGAQDGEQDEGDAHLVLQGRRSVGIVDKVGRCVGGGKRHGDDEVSGGETEKDEHEDLAGPPGK